MNEKSLEGAFRSAAPYKGKALQDYFAPVVAQSESQLNGVNRGFLITMATWVVRKFKNRGIPVGHMEKFCLPDGKAFNFLNALMAQVVAVLRKRGLKEADELLQDRFLQKFDEAFKRASR